jgi:hypothetical protein
MGTNYSLEDIPEDYLEVAEEWRVKLMESVAEIDDAYLSVILKILIPLQRRNAFCDSQGHHRGNYNSDDVRFGI